jgi:ABC-type Fe3+ transport system permease subunit
VRELELVFSVLGVVLLGAGRAVAERRRRLLTACVGILAALAIGWGLAARAVAVDYRDADGGADCWPDCSPFQDAVWATLFYAPVAAVLLLVTATALYALRRRRSRSG